MTFIVSQRRTAAILRRVVGVYPSLVHEQDEIIDDKEGERERADPGIGLSTRYAVPTATALAPLSADAPLERQSSPLRGRRPEVQTSTGTSPINQHAQPAQHIVRTTRTPGQARAEPDAHGYGISVAPTCG